MDATLDLQGHRGARGLCPENTLQAFARALTLGIGTLELDAAITADDVVVVSHDPVLNPDITRLEGRWIERGRVLPIRRLPVGELQRYDVGRIDPDCGYARRFPLQQAADGARVPTLAEVFALARRAGNDTVRFSIETKVSPERPSLAPAPAVFARHLIAEIRAAGMQSRTAIQSFDWRTLEIVAAEAPEIETVHLTVQQPGMDNIGAAGRHSAWTAGRHVSAHGGSVPKLVHAAGGRVWSPCHLDVTPQALDEARALGLRVVVWTVNEAADIGRMITLGVDGIISDYPDRLREAAAQRGLALPAGTPVHA
jgi:glycerophosphoryl diester phosphodiesterase